MRMPRVLLCALLALPALWAQEFDWKTIPAGEWVRVPTTGEAAPKVFHGGATIAPERGEVFFFGSDTHWPTPLEKGETNAVWRLNLATRAWSQDYEQDPKSSYRLLEGGVTETTAGRPWAMHTFDDVEWDPVVKRVVVISHPGHTRFEPEKRFPMFSGDWYKHLAPMQWEYDPDTRLWVRLETNAPLLFTKALTWDPDNKQLIGHDGEKTYQFDRERRRWTAYDAATVAAWHLSMVYDTYAHRALLLGNSKSSNVLFAYDPSAHRWGKVDTKGTCLPANGAAIAYDTKRKAMLYLANDYKNQYHNPTGKSVTFVYDSRRQSWRRFDVASPELYGMNYLMQYDPVRDVFLHFEKSRDSGDRITVWAFRLN